MGAALRPMYALCIYRLQLECEEMQLSLCVGGCQLEPKVEGQSGVCSGLTTPTLLPRTKDLDQISLASLVKQQM